MLERSPMEKAAAGTILLSFFMLVLLIIGATVLNFDIESQDQYITLILGYLMKEVGLLTVGRGGNGNGKPLAKEPAKEPAASQPKKEQDDAGF